VISFLVGTVEDGSSDASAQLVSIDIALFLRNIGYSDTDVLEGSRNPNRNVTCEKWVLVWGSRDFPSWAWPAALLKPSTFSFDLRLFFIKQQNLSAFFQTIIMSKRSSISDQVTNPPTAKKSRIDIDDTVAEVKTMSTQLLDELKAQKAAINWGHANCREDTVANIARAESLINSVGKLEKKSKEQVIVPQNHTIRG
jgi:hypothetical protein